MKLHRRALSLSLLLAGAIWFTLRVRRNSRDGVVDRLPHETSTLCHLTSCSSGSVTYDETLNKPKDIKVVGLVFFGRRIFVDILDCYLRKNLAANGGYLDEVRFVVHTEKEKDIDWLQGLIKKDRLEEYYKVLHDTQDLHGTVWGTFSNVWGRFATDDVLYVRLDDDIVWIDDMAIPRLVNTILDHPEAYGITANIVNSRWNHWYHLTNGAILPYLPEPAPGSGLGQFLAAMRPSWRASQLPLYPMSQLSTTERSYIPLDTPPPYKGHRWLPLPPTHANLIRSPFGIGDTLPDPKTSTKGPVNWQIAAQELYSLLHHIEHDTLQAYAFGRSRDGLWDPMYQHHNINFMAFRGETIRKRPFWGSRGDQNYIQNDEVAITRIVPRELSMPVYINTRAVVAHFSFHLDNQLPDLLQTDLLDRYRALANERVCSAMNQKRAFPEEDWP